jgi:hypothetical protein
LVKKGEKMKEIVSVLTVIIVFEFISCTTYSTMSSVGGNYERPAFGEDFSVVVDAWSGGTKYHDYLKLNSAKLQNNQLNFNIYGYDAPTKNWILLGSAVLKRFGDTDTVGTPYRDKLHRFRYFAVQSLNELSFNVQVSISRNDIYLTIQ